MKVYISGPITRDPDYLRKFSEAQASLASRGYGVINPVRLPGTGIKERWIDNMIICLGALKDAGAVAMLPGWEESKGAQWEKRAAARLGIPARPIEEFLREAEEVC